ncbi:MAG: hypothetical protein VKN33_02465 [Candidatus Sericytochromatia bacterium]|nr:hypothetical protein [Candidatus Sericytochromatia bacterium]
MSFWPFEGVLRILSLWAVVSGFGCILVGGHGAWAAPGGAGTPSNAPEVLLSQLIEERLAIPKPELTALQIEEAYRQFETSTWGRRVRIEAEVLDASNRPGGYFIHAQVPHMSRPMLFQAHKEAALAVRKGQKVVILGTLRGLQGIHLEPDLDQVSFPELPPPGGRVSPSPTPQKS